MDANCSQVTQVSDNRILLTKGYSQGGKLVEIDWSQSPPNKVVKRNPRALRTKLTNPVVHNGFAYSLSDGFLECVSLDDLSIRWKERTRAGAGQILIAGDWIFVHHEDGQLSLVAADPTGYRKQGSLATVSGICWNTLAVSGNRVIVRSNREMACVELAPAQATAALPIRAVPPGDPVADLESVHNVASRN
jgi:outer membrane protein assembly factor BamB